MTQNLNRCLQNLKTSIHWSHLLISLYLGICKNIEAISSIYETPIFWFKKSDSLLDNFKFSWCDDLFVFAWILRLKLFQLFIIKPNLVDRYCWRATLILVRKILQFHLSCLLCFPLFNFQLFFSLLCSQFFVDFDLVMAERKFLHPVVICFRLKNHFFESLFFYLKLKLILFFLKKFQKFWGFGVLGFWG